MKRCPKCKLEKNVELFSKNRTQKDGLESWCKKCKYSAEKAYVVTDAGRAAKTRGRAHYATTEKGKAAIARYQVEYDSKNKKKRRAHRKLNNQIKIGNIKSEPCEVCGVVKSQGHHDDYDLPLIVRWLCPLHHSQWHKDNGEGLNP